MLFKHFAEFLQEIENTASRNDMTVKLAEFIAKLKASEVKEVMYLLQGRLAPKFVALEFNFSQKMVFKALENKYKADIKELFSKSGDAGLVAEEIRSGKYEVTNDLFSTNEEATADKSIEEVYADLMNLANFGGKGSQEFKMNKYNEIISYLDPLSARYVTRMIVGSLRLGTSEKTVLDSFSWFLTGDKSLRKSIDSAFGSRSDLGELAEIIIKNKENENIKEILENIKIKPGVPVASKLVEREKTSAAVWERMPNCFVQPKLDGLRGQIHFSRDGLWKDVLGEEVLNSKIETLKGNIEYGIQNMEDKTLNESVEDPNSIFNIQNSEHKTHNPQLTTQSAIFSRNMESLTDQFPEILESVANLGVDSIILDSEIIGFNKEEGDFKSYQETMTRRRKNDIDQYAKDVPVKSMCFDILFLNGVDLTQKPLEERLKLLEEILGKQDSALDMLETKQMNSDVELEDYYKNKVENGLEGIITKQTGTTYDPGTRNFKWIKLKANSRADLVDTIDVAVLGYYIGEGDRSRFGFGALLAGVYEPKEDKYYSIGKIGSGMKDEDMEKMFADMQALRITDKPENVVVDKSLTPDFWVQPKIVMEIDADEITRSPNHTAARGIASKVANDDSTKGLSIRFPRMKKWNRLKDYPNTVEEIIRMYELRKG